MIQAVSAFGQDKFNDFQRDKHTTRFVFYNTENLFDIYDDSLKQDESFTPDGEKHWNNSKYYKKINDLSKVVMSVGGWDLPEVVSFCELENRRVLNDLIRKTPLQNQEYRILHVESPDRRGIDVGLIYRPEKVRVLDYDNIKIVFPWDSAYKTRDILYAQLLLFGEDTLHYFVNHWPSKWGGHMETEKSREHVASTLREAVLKIQNVSPNASILIMGDLNDTPSDKSVVKGLKASADTSCFAGLYNYSAAWEDQKLGTHKYQNEWSVIDQIIVSCSVFQNQSKLRVKDDQAYIFSEAFLLENDTKYGGQKPYRTYNGMKYNGGYSDHFPVYLDIQKNRNK